jgi:hypothetical protein
MKNKYLGFQIGFVSMFIWTFYDDQKKLNEHHKQWENHMAKYPDKYNHVNKSYK